MTYEQSRIEEIHRLYSQQNKMNNGIDLNTDYNSIQSPVSLDNNKDSDQTSLEQRVEHEEDQELKFPLGK